MNFEFEARVQRIKDSVPLSSIVGERVPLRGDSRWFRGCCPFHDDSTPSFWVNDEMGRYGCFGCDASGDVIGYLMAFEGCSFGEALDRLDGGYVPSRWPRPVVAPSSDEEKRRVELARKIWSEAQPIKGTPAETYLRRRALPLENLPDPLNLRFARLSFDGSIDLHPALIAPIQTVDNEFAGIQRTFLTEDGRKLDAHRSKRSLGALKGNAIRIEDFFNEGYSVVSLCEGLEDGLSHSRMYGWPVFVSGGAGAMPSVELPKECKKVLIGTDNDTRGLKAAEQAAAVFRARGIEAFVDRPPWHFKDWNEYLQFYETASIPHDHHANEVEWARG